MREHRELLSAEIPKRILPARTETRLVFPVDLGNHQGKITNKYTCQDCTFETYDRGEMELHQEFQHLYHGKWQRIKRWLSR